MNINYKIMGKIARVCNIIAVVALIAGIIVYFVNKQYDNVFQIHYKSVQVGSYTLGSTTFPKYEKVPDTSARIFSSIGLIAIFACPLSLSMSFLEFKHVSKQISPINIVNLILSSVLFRGVFACLLTQSIGWGAYSIGYLCNIGEICSIIVNIIRIIIIAQVVVESHKIKKDKNIERSKITTTQTLLDTVGTAVFVKYYDLWKDWSAIDLIDKLIEPYSEESKKSRIAAAKKIFSSGNNIQALELICNKQGGIDESTKAAAQTILAEEYKCASDKARSSDGQHPADPIQTVKKIKTDSIAKYPIGSTYTDKTFGNGIVTGAGIGYITVDFRNTPQKNIYNDQDD